MHDGLRRFIAFAASTSAAAFATGAAAAVDTWRIARIASSQDGLQQVVELEEAGGRNGQDRFAGLALTVTNRAGKSKTFVFPSDLPDAATAGRHAMAGPEFLSGGFVNGALRPDFTLPREFLPIDGGTLEFAGVDRWTFEAIPVDGHLLRRDGSITREQVQNYAGKTSPCCGPVFPYGLPGIEFTPILVVDYYNAGLDHYFISGSQPDIDALESGRTPGWKQVQDSIGGFFGALSSPEGYAGYDLVPVCRYFIPPASHFFSAFADECKAVGELYPDFVLETRAAFYVALPDSATGACPPPGGAGPLILDFQPVYRLWNRRPDTNHRFTSSPKARSEMIDKGWVPEGYGPTGVAWCGIDWE